MGIPTTHAGSLPRPLELTGLYGRRAQGGAVDAEALAVAGREATEAIVARQVEAGITIGNNGEQQREGFFLYVQHRMSGFGGRWKRPGRQDVFRYPGLVREYETFLRVRAEAVSNMEPPMNLGEVRYVDRVPLEDECRTFHRALEKDGGGFAQPFMTAPSPGIVVSAMQSSHYADREAYLADVAEALRVEYEAVVANGWLLQIDAPDLAMERHFLFADEPLRVFQDWVEVVVETLNRALANVPRDCVRLHVCWGNYEGPHDLDVELRDVLPILLQADVGGLVLPFANPRHQHEVEELRRRPLAPDQYLVAGVIDTTTNYVEHPGNRCRAAGARGPRCGRSGAHPGGHGLRLRHLRRHGPCAGRRGLGQAPHHGRRRPHRERPAGCDVAVARTDLYQRA